MLLRCVVYAWRESTLNAAVLLQFIKKTYYKSLASATHKIFSEYLYFIMCINIAILTLTHIAMFLLSAHKILNTSVDGNSHFRRRLSNTQIATVVIVNNC